MDQVTDLERSDNQDPRAPVPADNEANENPGAAKRKDAKKGIGLWRKLALSAIAIVIAVSAGAWYWHETVIYPSTSDAYIGANVVRIAPLVAGRIAKVDVRSFQKVQAGDVLVEIDKKPLEAALAGANARLQLARQQAKASEAAVTAAQAKLDQAEAELADTKRQTARTEILAQKGDASQSDRDDASARLKSAEATVAASQAGLKQAQRQLGATGDENASVKAAAADVAHAQLNLDYATINAPVDGIVGEVDIRPGAVVAVGTALFPLVDGRNWWVDANFKETDLERIKPGQQASVTLDLYPSRTIHGTVTALSPASGVAFSLLPPENATGNWVKVTQRFPVRVTLHLDKTSPQPRIGASSNVTIDTRPSTDGDRRS